MLITQAAHRDIEAERAALHAAIDGRTLCSELARTAAANPSADALRWREGDVWRSSTYREQREQVRAAGLGLRALGLRAGGFGLVLTGNRPEHVVAAHAMVHVQGTPVGIYEAIAASQLAYIAQHCEAAVAVVDAERLGMLLRLRPQLPHLRHVVVCGEAPDAPADDWVIGWGELLALGRAEHRRDPWAFDLAAMAVAPDDVATVIYTSGTTGPPKGVVLTHRFALSWVAAMGEGARVGVGDRVVSYLPLAHCTSQWLTQWLPVVTGSTTWFCADPADLVATFRAARPTLVLGVPRVWDKLRGALARAGSLEAIGLDACRIPIVCAAPCPPDLIEAFHAHGLPLSDGWGMTELGFGTWNGLQDIRPGTIGTPITGVEARLAEDGELLVRGACMMSGYYKDEARTAETIDAEGWLHTGDVAAVDADGVLSIVGRKKELIISSSGKNIAPVNLESMLLEHPLIAQCCVVGDGRDHLGALVVLDPQASASPDPAAEVARHVAAVNERVSVPERIAGMAILADEWTVAGEELTPTLKLRRAAVERKYAAAIEAMYA